MILTRDAPPRIIFTWTVSFEVFFETHLGLVLLIELFSDSSHLPTFELRQRSLCAGPARRRRSPVKTRERNRRHRHPVRRGGFDQYRTGATRPTQSDNPVPQRCKQRRGDHSSNHHRHCNALHHLRTCPGAPENGQQARHDRRRAAASRTGSGASPIIIHRQTLKPHKRRFSPTAATSALLPTAPSLRT
jgi:hypothetical protein